MSKWLSEIELKGSHVTLTPLKQSHSQELLIAASNNNLNDLWYTNIPDRDSIDQYIQNAISEQENGTMLPFIVIDNKSNKIIGTTRFLNSDSDNKRTEIGYTWYAKAFHKTAVNTECKLLLLSHAFEELNAIAVELRNHFHNHQSRNAILRLGAKQDGILRSHSITQGGLIRDTVVYSIIKCEWPTVKHNLKFKLKTYIN